MESTIYVIVAVVGLIVGAVISKIMAKRAEKKKVSEAEGKAEIILKEAEINAENIKKEKIIITPQKKRMNPTLIMPGRNQSGGIRVGFGLLFYFSGQ